MEVPKDEEFDIIRFRHLKTKNVFTGRLWRRVFSIGDVEDYRRVIISVPLGVGGKQQIPVNIEDLYCKDAGHRGRLRAKMTEIRESNKSWMNWKLNTEKFNSWRDDQLLALPGKIAQPVEKRKKDSD